MTDWEHPKSLLGIEVLNSVLKKILNSIFMSFENESVFRLHGRYPPWISSNRKHFYHQDTDCLRKLRMRRETSPTTVWDLEHCVQFFLCLQIDSGPLLFPVQRREAFQNCLAHILQSVLVLRKDGTVSSLPESWVGQKSLPPKVWKTQSQCWSCTMWRLLIVCFPLRPDKGPPVTLPCKPPHRVTNTSSHKEDLRKAKGLYGCEDLGYLKKQDAFAPPNPKAWVQSPGSTWRKERANSDNFSSALQINKLINSVFKCWLLWGCCIFLFLQGNTKISGQNDKAMLRNTLAKHMPQVVAGDSRP